VIVPRDRDYLLAVLFVVQVFSNVDGIALGLVLQDIKFDLSLTDTQLGLLTGIAFALMYTLAGIAIARWSDRGNRVAIIALSAATWSILVAACGTARSFVQLFVLRIGVGIGEAGCFPASQSLLADYFDRAERPRANAIVIMAVGAAYLIGYGMAGWLNQVFGWRVMFVILGVPGLGVSALAWFTLQDPRFANTPDGGEEGRSAYPAPPAPPLKDTAVALWTNVTLRHLVVFWSVMMFLGFGLGQWRAAFFVRSYGLKTGELGTLFAVVFAVGGTVGTLLGGTWASNYAANNERLQLRAAAGVCCGLTVLSPLMYLMPNYYLALGLVGLYVLISNALSGPFWAIIQTLVPQSMRAAATAISLLLSNLIGIGLGSLATGVLSDALSPRFGSQSLRYASLALCPGFVWAAWHLWRASKSVTRDLASANQHNVGRNGPMEGAPASAAVRV
jgi:MFS family permease